MATYVLQNSAQQIDQAVTAAYSGLVLGGTGLARTTGTQTISGVKTFADQIVFSSGAILGNPTELNAVKTIIPTGNANVDLGSASNRFKTGWFSGISGSVGVFQNLTVLGTLNATIVPASTLDNSTGNNVTLSGTTNLNNANFSGNINSAGTNTFSGNLNVTGNSVFNGTITATGNKTFSGIFSQTGNSSFFGAFTQSGTLFSTGVWNHTGNFNQTGDCSFVGGVSINSPNGAFNFSGNSSKFNIISDFGISGITNITGSCNITGAQHAIAGNIIHTGSFSHSGDTILIGATRNTGDFFVIGTSVLSGRATFPSGITLSGNSSAPELVLNCNLTTTPSGGAIEYGNDGRFYFSNEISGAPNRTLLNQVHTYVSPQQFFVGNAGTGVTSFLLGSTGIYLNTGTYHINYNTRLTKGGTSRAIWLGITGSANNFTQKFGVASKLTYAYYSYYENSYSRIISGDTASSAVFQSGANATYTEGDLGIDISTDDKFLKYFTFDCVVTITGNTKVQPFFRINPGETSMTTTESVTGTQFNMRVTQLTTGTGVGLASASGPWSNA